MKARPDHSAVAAQASGQRDRDATSLTDRLCGMLDATGALRTPTSARLAAAATLGWEQ